MNNIDYFAKDLDEIRCDVCDAFLCSGYIDYADSCGFLCQTCKKQKELEQIPEITAQKQKMLERKQKEKLCGESTEGHNWIDITHQTLCFGNTVYCCTKCGADKLEPLKASLLLASADYSCIKN